MKLMISMVLPLIFVMGISVYAADRAVLVHNSLKEIDACKGKVKLELVRIWGGDEEDDENKFFRTPTSVAVDKNKQVYICDEHSHCIKVFKSSGEYVRTIGRRGRGPGDVYTPYSIALSPNGDLVVYESSGCRIQRFNPEGKSINIIKMKDLSLAWVGVTSKDQLAVYNHDITLRSGKLISILDKNGKTIRQIGTYHDKSKDFLESEKLDFAIDENDNIYAGDKNTPVIRKYSPDGKLLLAITFEVPFEIPPFEITLNSGGDEIKIKKTESGEEIKLKKGRMNSVNIQRTARKGKRRVTVIFGIGTDSQKRIYIISRRRLVTEKDRSAGAIIWTPNSIKRENLNSDISKNIDAYRLLVFNPGGKVKAEAQLTSFCEDIHIHNNRIFIVDGVLNQRILEYEMSFKQ